jgi:hypothetical protein
MTTTYGLDAFVKDIKTSLKADNGPGGRKAIRDKMELLLQNKEFVARALPPGSMDGHRKLYEDAEQSFVVLAHYHTKHRLSPPHDHGPSWAIYGQAEGWSEMGIWQRTDGGAGEAGVELKQTESFRLTPGKAGIFDVGHIHSVDRNDGVCAYIRVTGRDLDYVKRYRYDLEAKKAVAMEAATVAGR